MKIGNRVIADLEHGGFTPHTSKKQHRQKNKYSRYPRVGRDLDPENSTRTREISSK